MFGTFGLEIVEMVPLPNKSGVQILWRNPDGFRPKSGEYVKIQCPWLSKGGNEWHPFSIYLKESTKIGYKTVHSTITQDNSNHVIEELIKDSTSPLDHEGQTLLSLEVYIRKLLSSANSETSMRSSDDFLVAEAREDISTKYKTTQVFVYPLGDWTEGLMDELADQQQLRACWVRGPYTSPYSVAPNYSHFILIATGIGITPALGVMAQYPGSSRTKIVIWSTRDKELLKFFCPLLKDAHVAVICYTGKDSLSSHEILAISSFGNIYLQQSRPKSFPGMIETIVLEYENHWRPSTLSYLSSMQEIEMKKKTSWCTLYCGGSSMLETELRDFSKSTGLGFQSELFDW